MLYEDRDFSLLVAFKWHGDQPSVTSEVWTVTLLLGCPKLTIKHCPEIAQVLVLKSTYLRATNQPPDVEATAESGKRKAHEPAKKMSLFHFLGVGFLSWWQDVPLPSGDLTAPPTFHSWHGFDATSEK